MRIGNESVQNQDVIHTNPYAPPRDQEQNDLMPTPFDDLVYYFLLACPLRVLGVKVCVYLLKNQ